MSRILKSLAALIILSAPAQGQQANHTFNLYIAGVKAGSIQIKAHTAGNAYSLAGAVQPGSLLRRLRDVGYSGSAAGSVRGKNHQPKRYQGETRTGSRVSNVKMRYSNGRPIVDSYLPKREKRAYDIDPAKQTGTVDLLTAAHIVFQDQNVTTLCNRTIPMFDGRRRSKLTLSKPKLKDNNASCNGTYTRLAGFSAEDMKERVNFPFSLVYNRLDDQTYRLHSFSSKTTFGSAKGVRR